MAITNNFASGTAGSGYTPNTYTELGNAIGKVARQVIKMLEADDKLSIFDKTPVDNGDTIETILGKLVEPYTYDSTGASAMTRDTAQKLYVMYFKNWQRHTYKTTIDLSMLRKILLTGTDDGTIAEMIVSELGQSRIYDKYQSYKALMAWARSTGSYGTGTAFKALTDIALKDSKTDYTGILKAVKKAVKGMQYVNSDFNGASVKNRTKNEDIVILMPYQLTTDLDVDSLSGFFNIDKAEIKNHIIEIDVSDTASVGETPAYNYIYIVDKNAIIGATRLYEMLTQQNADGAFWNYFLHVEDMFAVCPLYNAVSIKYNIA